MKRAAHLRALAFGLLLVLVGCGTGRVADGGPTDAKSITYQVQYGDLSVKGEADVTYTDADGQSVTKHVPIPWKSDVIAVKSGQRYRIDATAPARNDTNFACGVDTDTGWTSGPSLTGGHCSFTYPDDAK
jgi:hypothetical protein